MFDIALCGPRPPFACGPSSDYDPEPRTYTEYEVQALVKAAVRKAKRKSKAKAK